MLLEEALAQQLAEDSGVATIAADRVFPVEIPQFEKGVATYPCVVFRLANRPGIYTLDGATNTAESTIEIFCLSPDYLQAKRLARAVRISLDGVTEVHPLAAVGSDKLGCFKQGETDTKEVDAIEELDVFNIIQTWLIRHVEE